MIQIKSVMRSCEFLNFEYQTSFLRIDFFDIQKASFVPFMVPVAGLEPARCRHRGILSPLRLPIPPHRHITNNEPQNIV